MQGLQLRQLLVAGTLRHHASGVGLQQTQQVVHVSQITRRHLGDIGAAPDFHGDQPFGGQHFEGFAQRRATDAVMLRYLQFVNPATRLQLAVENALTQQFSDFFVKRARCKRRGGHAKNCKLGGIF